MDTKPKISVIVPIYKVEAYLPKCLDSLVGQTYRNLEIILVEDGSPDNCGAICDAYAAKDARIRVIHKKNGGVSSARNAGLAAVTGDLIGFVDGDDFIAPDMYERLYAHMSGDPRLDVVYCAATRFPAQEQHLHMDYYPTGTVVTGRELARRMLLDEVCSHMWLALYKRFCWEGIVFPEGRTYEDLSMTYRAFLRVGYVGFLMEPLYYYRMNDVSITQTVKPRKSYDIFLAFQDHYYGALEFFPELADQCCAKAAQFATSLYFHYCAAKVEELAFAIPEVQSFLDEHEQTVKRAWNNMPRSRRLAARVYYLSPALFRMGARFLYLTGLQKKLGFQLK
ncbi:MAG: glycosyltransferase [Oscillospiraceae bacterium]|nr:glycosyltransferase [Oscillospiraceae bacterium]